MSKLPKKQNNTTYYKKFERISDKVSKIVGSPYWFIFSIILIMIWLPSGYFLGWSEIWHLLINTTTTILTFLMVALLHSSQSRWEDKMERLQQKEKTELRAIEKTTKKIAYDKGETVITPSDVAAEDGDTELIDSLR